MLMHDHCQDDKQAKENKNMKNWIVVSLASTVHCVCLLPRQYLNCECVFLQHKHTCTYVNTAHAHTHTYTHTHTHAHHASPPSVCLLPLYYTSTSVVCIRTCVLQCNFLFSMVWSIGATTEADGREKFDVFFRDLVGGKNEAHPVPDTVGKLEVPLPADSLVFDFMFEVGTIIVVSCVVWWVGGWVGG